MKSLLPFNLLFAFLCSVGLASAAEDRSNIVLFFVDDLGWADVGYTLKMLDPEAPRYYETPAIDALAEEGMVFWDAYSCGPNCAPSRASLMSGFYTPRHGIFTVGDPRRGNHKQRMLEPVENKTVLDSSFTTIAERLRLAGYKTASMGKWHLGKNPQEQGFDVNVAGREWGSPSGGGYHSPLKYPNLEVKEKGVYLTDAITDRACEFIEKNKDRPFFLYLSHYAVHTPLQGKQELVLKYKNKPATEEHSNATYAAMIESMDESLRRVRATLKKHGVAENTVVIFHSDNGGHSGATSNAPLRGAKGMLYEGGIRVPLCVLWPGVTKSGTVCREPVIAVDLYPTMLDIAGGLNDPGMLDGESLRSLLSGENDGLARRAIYWHFPCYLQGKGDPRGGPFRTTPAGAIRMGDWKLIEWFETGHRELYNLSGDPGEKMNLIDEKPEKRDELYRELLAWRKRVKAPITTEPNPLYRK